MYPNNSSERDIFILKVHCISQCTFFATLAIVQVASHEVESASPIKLKDKISKTTGQLSFVTVGELLQLLKTQEYTHKTQVQVKRIQSTDLVIIDDLMYMAMDQREANSFFQLINHLYEKNRLF